MFSLAFLFKLKHRCPIMQMFIQPTHQSVYYFKQKSQNLTHMTLKYSTTYKHIPKCTKIGKEMKKKKIQKLTYCWFGGSIFKLLYTHQRALYNVPDFTLSLIQNMYGLFLYSCSTTHRGFGKLNCV